MEIRIRWLRSLCLFALLFVETSYVCAAVSGDDLHVPYVPYVVVDKNKDEFDYDRLQDEILGYLNRRHSEASTTLYDFLRTSLSPAATPPTAVADVRSISLPSSPSSPSPSSSSYYTVGYPTNPARTAGTAYSVSSVRPPAGATYPVSSVRPGSVAAAYPAYPASIYKSSKKENPLVTAKVRVTTYQPHRYSTPLDNSARGYAPQRDVVSPVWSQSPPPPLPPARQPPFVRVRDHGFTPIAVTSTTTDSAVYITTAVDLKPTSRLPYPSKCPISSLPFPSLPSGGCAASRRIGPIVAVACDQIDSGRSRPRPRPPFPESLIFVRLFEYATRAISHRYEYNRYILTGRFFKIRPRWSQILVQRSLYVLWGGAERYFSSRYKYACSHPVYLVIRISTRLM